MNFMGNAEKKSSFSQNLARIRKEKGLSQKKLAESTSLTQRMISYYENEATKPPIDNIEAIAKALNIKLHDLIETNNQTSADSKNDFSQIDSRTIRKIKLILSLPKEERHIIYSMAEAFIAKRKLQKAKN